MGSRDYRQRETKKTKKGAGKIAPINIIPPPAQVEVITKKKKRDETEETDK